MPLKSLTQMDPNLWKEIEVLFNKALNLPIDQRQSFIEKACAGDKALHNELISLLNEAQDEGNFLSEPIFDIGRARESEIDSLAGKKLGAYTLNRMVGRGGMGEVYEAQDERLGRRVALKLLRKLLVHDQDQITRFRHEARSASAISHPNVAHIYEIGEADGRFFIAMEFVDGVTLREESTRGSLTVRHALDIATQVAHALGAAHAEGIVHRDIKPENIMIRRDGLVKVVDFGLAKLTKPKRVELDPRITQTGSRVTQLAQTEPGLLLGTATYMSPEQARGQDVDARTDLWSWAVVFYELLFGHPPFVGATNSDVIAEIIKSEPPMVSGRTPKLPTLAIDILRCSLAKEKDSRYPNAAPLLADLQKLLHILNKQHLLDAPLPIQPGPAETPISDVGSGVATSSLASTAIDDISPAPALRERMPRRIVAAVRKRALILIFSMIILALSLAWVKFGFFNKPAPTPRAALETTYLTDHGQTTDAAISPDGRLLAYTSFESGNQSVLIRNLRSGENWEVVTPSPARYWGLRFTHNGENLFYVTTQPSSTVSVLYRIPTRGGQPQKLATNIDSRIGLSPDEMQMAFVRGNPNQRRDSLIVANVDGTDEKELLVRRYPDKIAFSGVSWSPDNKLIAVGASENETKLAILGVPVSGGSPVELTPWQWSALGGLAWKNDGRTLLFSGQPSGTRALNVWEVSYPLKELKQITNDADRKYEGIILGSDSVITTVPYEISDLWYWKPSEPPRRLTTDENSGAAGLAVTPDGRIIYGDVESGKSRLWSMNINGLDLKPTAKNFGFFPSASENGLVAYVSSEGGSRHIWVMDIDGQNNRQLTTGEGEGFPTITPDGRTVVYVSNANERGTLWKIPTVGGKPVQLTNAVMSRKPVISPDGSKIACIYRMDGPDLWKVAVLPIGGGKPLQTLTIPDSYHQIIRWTPDGKALTYLERIKGVDNLWRKPLDGSPTEPITNFDSELILHYSWLPNGDSVLVRGREGRDIVMIKNFD